MKRVVLAMLLMFGLVGCGGQSWQTKDIAGLMPPLQLHLSGTTGAPLTETALRGRITLLLFGFTHCPDVCPTSLQKLAALKRGLPQELQQRLRIVFVSVDPARDAPAALARYAAYFDDAILGVTGSEAELRALSRRYRTTFSYGEREDDGHYAVSHSNGVYVFDREGGARLLFRTGDSLEAMRVDLLRLLQEPG
jgi:protein SCO1/2